METILAFAPPAIYVVMLVLERLFPARPLPKVRFWLAKGLFFFTFTGIVASVFPALFAQVLGDRSLLHLQRLGTVAGGIAGFVLSDFVGYWVHRTMHRFPTLWRWTHQMHHSAERMDLAGMSYGHPFDTITTFALTSFAAALLGLTPSAAGIAGLLGFLSAVVQHMNIRTPRWIGWLVMRPEAHGLHHQRGIHAYNYGNVPLWDIVFGTFRNPGSFPAEYGFWDGASSKLGSMLVGRDVGTAP